MARRFYVKDMPDFLKHAYDLGAESAVRNC